MADNITPVATVSSRQEFSNALTLLFTSFRSELDTYHDTREKIFKTSRDITALSKKVIFVLHRITHSRSPDSIFAEADTKIGEIINLMKSIHEHLKGDNFYRYRWSIVHGIEEFIEAISFLHFLRHRTIITLLEIQEVVMSKEGTPYVTITPREYILGLADLTGELMRYAINSIGTGDPKVAQEVATFIRQMKAVFEPLVHDHLHPLCGKLDTMKASLRKVEDASYALQIRGAEYGSSSPHLLEYIRGLTASEDISD